MRRLTLILVTLALGMAGCGAGRATTRTVTVVHTVAAKPPPATSRTHVAAKPPPATTATQATIPCTGNRSGRCTAAPTTTGERSALPTAANCHAPNRSPHMERSCVEQQEDEEWAAASPQRKAELDERKRRERGESDERESPAGLSEEQENAIRNTKRAVEHCINCLGSGQGN